MQSQYLSVDKVKKEKTRNINGHYQTVHPPLLIPTHPHPPKIMLHPSPLTPTHPK